MNRFKKQSVHTLDVEGLAYGGAGIAKPEGFVVFVQGAIPGDRVRGRIVKKTKSHAEAVIESIEQPSSFRIEPPCKIFDICGGCTWQHLAYEDQLEWKRRQVEETISRIGGVRNLPEVLPMLPSPDIWRYRNKMEFSFGENDQGETILGFHVPGRFDRIFEVGECLIHPEPFDALLTTLQDWAQANRLTSYRQHDHAGFLRHAVMRHSRHTGGVVLALITNEGKLPDPEGLTARLRESCPELQGFLWGVNAGVADVARVRGERYAWGDLVLREKINGLTFDISPMSFFQTNSAGAEQLYRVTLEMADLKPDHRVLDAYCGAGTIGLHCAREADTVVGVEMSLDAVRDARENARRNKLNNATFICAPMRRGLRLAESAANGKFSCVIIDPPRGGMDKKSLAALIELRAPTFVYVSCNPGTLARDLATLAEAGYEIDRIQPVDMFPHSYHIETVVKLRLPSDVA